MAYPFTFGKAVAGAGCPEQVVQPVGGKAVPGCLMSTLPGIGEELAELRLLHQELGYRLKELEDQVLGAATSSDRAQLPVRAASIVPGVIRF